MTEQSNEGFTVGPTGMMEQVIDTGATPEQLAEENLRIAREREAALATSQEEVFVPPPTLEEIQSAENQRIADATNGLTISRIVEYRSRTGNYSVPAIVNCTINSIYQPGVESGDVPAITSVDRVHLTVFTPGKPGKRVEADNFVVASEEEVSENVAGCYQEWNIPFDPDAGPGTWRWPTRV